MSTTTLETRPTTEQIADVATGVVLVGTHVIAAAIIVPTIARHIRR